MCLANAIMRSVCPSELYKLSIAAQIVLLVLRMRLSSAQSEFPYAPFKWAFCGVRDKYPNGYQCNREMAPVV